MTKKVAAWPDRRTFLGALGALMSVPMTARGQRAGAFPERAMTLYCPWTAGSNTDLLLRSLADVVSRELGGKHRMLVESKPGAGGALGAAYIAANAKPDGYSLSQAPISVFRFPHVTKTKFDPVNDLTWIINTTGYHFGVTVRTDSPWKTWQELIGFARANPGKLRYGTSGIGTSLHLTMEDIGQREKIDWLHVPYKSQLDIVAALRGGHVDAIAGTPPWEHVSNGVFRVLVTWSEKPNRRAPDLPTFKQLYGIVANSPWGIVGPKGMDPTIVKLLHDAFRKAMDDPKYQQMADLFGQEPYYMSTEDYTAWARKTAEIEKAAVYRLGLQAK
jgi:tripartite-type tricarboxylate transporter receptor subunit TctC